MCSEYRRAKRAEAGRLAAASLLARLPIAAADLPLILLAREPTRS
jgi:hypothetical protein